MVRAIRFREALLIKKSVLIDLIDLTSASPKIRAASPKSLRRFSCWRLASSLPHSRPHQYMPLQKELGTLAGGRMVENELFRMLLLSMCKSKISALWEAWWMSIPILSVALSIP